MKKELILTFALIFILNISIILAVSNSSCNTIENSQVRENCFSIFKQQNDFEIEMFKNCLYYKNNCKQSLKDSTLGTDICEDMEENCISTIDPVDYDDYKNKVYCINLEGNCFDSLGSKKDSLCSFFYFDFLKRTCYKWFVLDDNEIASCRKIKNDCYNNFTLPKNPSENLNNPPNLPNKSNNSSNSDSECQIDSDCTAYFNTCNCNYNCIPFNQIPTNPCINNCNYINNTKSCVCLNYRCSEINSSLYQTNNASKVCDTITEEKYKRICYRSINPETPDFTPGEPSFCDSIEDPSAKNTCYWATRTQNQQSGNAGSQRDISMCDQFTDPILKDRCIRNILGLQ